MTARTGRYDTVVLDGFLVRRRRQERDLTQEQVAAAIGRTRGYVSVIEASPAKRVSRATAEALADALGVKADVLFAQQTSPTVTRGHVIHEGGLARYDPAERVDLLRRALRHTEEARILLETLLRDEEGNA